MPSRYSQPEPQALIISAILACFIISCTGNKTSSESADTVRSVTLAQTTPDTVHRNADPSRGYDTLMETDDDCVFNNDFKGLTTDWLEELKINDFIWRDDLKGALIPAGEDTVFLSKGGCSHFGTSVELWIHTETPDLIDSTFWISKALELADQYEMTDYAELIRKRKLKISNLEEDRLWFEVFPDRDTEVYEGINIIIDKKIKRLSISKYSY
ncbi:MAG: hypothetical protein JNK18_00815 [Cyclobacteriaceae bacterium]|nr:hypothetical protein [Cyclobacteriaceae bacterium]